MALSSLFSPAIIRPPTSPLPGVGRFPFLPILATPSPSTTDLGHPMGVVLPVVSFVCSALLALLVYPFWTARNIPTLTLISWLLVCNVIQGINSIVWAQNTVARIPVWCDIATKLLMGARVALPAACLSASFHLYRCAITRDTKPRRCYLWLDCIFCFMLPVIYMTLHIIVQDFRYDLTEAFGCTPSVYPSVPAIVLIWMPPLLLSTCTFIAGIITTYSYARIHHHFARTPQVDASRPRFSYLLRPLISNLLVVSLVICLTAFVIRESVTSPPGLRRWTSWSTVHAQLSTIHVVKMDRSLELGGTEVLWWTIPACSLALILNFMLGLVCQAQHSDHYRRFASCIGGASLRVGRTHDPSDSFMDLRSRMYPRLSDVVTSAHHSSKSDTESTIPSKSVTQFQPSPISIAIPHQDPKDPESAPSTTTSEDFDDPFARSTLMYLSSPSGQRSLGLTSQMPSRPPHPQASIGAVGREISTRNACSDAPGSPPSLSHSILSDPWPRPPSAIPVSPVTPIAIHPPSPGPTFPISRPPSAASFSISLVPSTISTSAYATDPDHALHDSPTVPQFAPFSDAAAPAGGSHGRGLSLDVPKRTRRKHSRDGLLSRNLSLSLRTKDQDNGAEGIYMTVVKETE